MEGINIEMATTGDTAANMLSRSDMDVTGEDMKKSSSRFQVARVDSQSDRRGSGDCACVELGTPQSGPGSPGGARFSISTNSVTNSNTYDTSNNPCGWGNTHEALPSEEHYRNIFSATPGMKSRPTLAELHEEIIVSSLSSATDIVGCTLLVLSFKSACLCVYHRQ